MSLHQDIREQVKDAMRAKDALHLNVLRGLLSSFTNDAVSRKKKPDEELSDEEALNVIGRAVKQRKDSIAQFEKGNRADLAEVEKSELEILEKYLPTQMSKDEILTFVRARQAELNMTDFSKKNQFMGTIMKELKGKTDGSVVREIIDTLFSPEN